MTTFPVDRSSALLPLRQIVAKPPLADVAGEVRRQWQASSLPERLKRGARIAVADSEASQLVGGACSTSLVTICINSCTGACYSPFTGGSSYACSNPYFCGGGGNLNCGVVCTACGG